MTTITMTFRQLKEAIVLCDDKCVWSAYGNKCRQSNCPIWKQAERREAKKIMGRSGTPLVKDGKIVRLPKKRSCGNCGKTTCVLYGFAEAKNDSPCKSWKPRR